MEWEQLLATLDFCQIVKSKQYGGASEDPREVVMRILNHPFIQAFLLYELSGLAGYRVLMFRISLVDTFYFSIHTHSEVLNALDSAISLWKIYRFY